MVVTYLVARACDRDWPDGLSVVKAWLDGHHPDEEDEHGIRAGAIYDLRDLEGCDAEQLAVDWRREAQFLLADIRLAGGFKKYLRQPIVDLNVLRLLCEQWRAIAPSGVLARLFHGPLPKELFVHVLSFWRSARALDEDGDGYRQRLRELPPPWSTGG